MSPSRPRRAVFLDRDDTLIDNAGDLGDPARVRLLHGVPEALASLHDAGFRLVVVTNQGGVARGRYGEADVDAVHVKIAELLRRRTGQERIIDRFYFCPFHPEAVIDAFRGDHPWRKPRPGMLLQAASDLGLDLERSWLIGDAPRDVAAGRAAGCRTIRVPGRDPGRPGEPARPDEVPTATAPNVLEAARRILEETVGDRASVYLRPWPTKARAS